MINLNQVNVVDNFIPSNFQDYIYHKCTINSNWILLDLNLGTSYDSKASLYSSISKDNNILNNIHESFQFIRTIINTQSSTEYSPETFPFISILHHLHLHLDFKYNLFPYKLRINLQTPSNSSNKNQHNSPHIDNDPPLPNTYTLIYYVNDSDGDTIVFNEKYEGFPIKNFSVDKRVSAKKGRMVMFPSDRFHCGSHPINSKARIVINANFYLIPL